MALPSIRLSRQFSSPLMRRLFGGAIWSIAGTAFGSGLSLISMMVLARLLGTEDYGRFIAVQGTLGMVGMFAGFGIGTTATRYVAGLRASDPGRLGKILALTEKSVMVFGVVGTLFLVADSRAIAAGALNSELLAAPLAIAAISVVFAALDGYQKSVLIGLEAMKAMAFGAALSACLSVPVALFCGWYAGLTGSAVGLVATAMIQAAVSRVQVRRHLAKQGLQIARTAYLSEWRVLRDFAFPSLLSSILVTPANWFCQTMLAHLPNGYAELALFGVAMQWFNALMFLPNVACRVLLPVLSEQIGAGEKHQAGSILKATILSNVVVALPIAVGMAAASPWIIKAYGAQFQHGGSLLAVTGFVTCLAIMAAPLGQFLAAEDKMWVGAAMNFGWAMLYVCVALKLVEYGALGIVLSMGIAYLCHALWSAAFVAIRLRALRRGYAGVVAL